MFQLILNVIPVIFVYMTIMYIISLVLHRNDIADIGWGLGFIITTGYFILQEPIITTTKIVIFMLVLLWGIRLSTHIWMRNRGRQEDFRYLQWRKDWGNGLYFYIRSYVQVFLLQGLFMLLILLPTVSVLSVPQSFFGVTFMVMTGLVIWVIGFFFESVGDYQLSQFKKDPKNKGKILQTGLWKYTRHPNYFGEVTMWWGVWVMTFGSVFWIQTIISPIVITCLILFVSGVPMLEKKYQGNKEFEEYKKRTSVFIPWFPKKK